MSGAERSGDGSAPALDAIVIAGSLGAVPVLRTVLRGLPADFPVPVLVVQHRWAGGRDALGDLLPRFSRLPVHDMQSGQRIGAPGVYSLPPGKSAAVTADLRLVLGESRTRRPADTLLESLALALRNRCCAVVLSGRLDDGARGVRAIKRASGRALVQDPATARETGMPTSALATGCVDLVLPPRILAPALIALALAPGAAELLAVPAANWADLSA